MSNLCNSLNIKTLKISQLREYNTVNSDDIFLVIESSDSLYSRRTTFGNIVNSLQYIDASYVGRFTGSFTGSAFGKLTGSFSGNGYGNFNGTFTGSIVSNNFKGSGSFYSNNFKGTGSFYGVDYVNNFRGTGKKVSFNGTASYAVSSSFSTFANAASSLTTTTGGPVGTTNQFAYWDGTTSLGSTNYIFRSPSTTNVSGVGTVGDSTDPVYFGVGRNSLTKPLHFNVGDAPYLVGENILFRSSAGKSIYGIGMQENTLYLRTDANFVMYHSGTFANNPPEGGSDDKRRYLRPGKDGYTVFSSCQRLIGLGWFDKSTDIAAQCHIHLSGSNGYRSGYNPNTNAFLITSGSISNKLLRVKGDGQLDVLGDIIALSTFTPSDQRLKKDIHPIKNPNQLIDQLNPVQFKWISNNQNDYGLIAQEVEQVYPEFIKEDMNGYKTVKYNSFIPILIKSVQDLCEEINQLKQKIKELEK